MIEKFRGYYKPVCSICGEELPRNRISFLQRAQCGQQAGRSKRMEMENLSISVRRASTAVKIRIKSSGERTNNEYIQM